MDAFEQLVAETLWHDGYWATTSVRVSLTREDLAIIERPTSPAWELDVVAYSPGRNELLVVECKSYLDSTGVTYAELKACEGRSRGRYKLFCEERLREVVLDRLLAQFAARDTCAPDAKVQLGLAVGKFKRGDEAAIRTLFAERHWMLIGPDWLRDKLKALSADSYRNQTASIVAKMLLRNSV
jgi:hypothetical protein